MERRRIAREKERERLALQKEKERLAKEKELQEKYDELTNKLDELEADPVLIEKIARQRYGMHKPNEEIFIFDD